MSIPVTSFQVGPTHVRLEDGPDGPVLSMAGPPGPTSRIAAVLAEVHQRELLRVLSWLLGYPLTQDAVEVLDLVPARPVPAVDAATEAARRQYEGGLPALRATHLQMLLDSGLLGGDLDDEARNALNKALYFILHGGGS